MTEITITPSTKPIALSNPVLGAVFSGATSGRSTTSTPPALVMRMISVGATVANASAIRQASFGSAEVTTTSSSCVSEMTETCTMRLSSFLDSAVSPRISARTESRTELLSRILEYVAARLSAACRSLLLIVSCAALLALL